MTCAKCPMPVNRWTAIKLQYLDRYLQAYVTAAKGSTNRAYLDAFAGCGRCVLKDTRTEIDGSALRALKSVPGFTEYHLIEKDKDRCKHLKQATRDYTNVTIYEGDCNDVIPARVLKPTGMSPRAASFAFLDPPGLNLRWSTVAALSQYRYDPKNRRKMELLILYPFDMAIDRQLRIPANAPILDAYFGNEEWRSELSTSVALNETVDQRRERFVGLYVRKLEALGYQYVFPLGPLGYKRRKLYFFIFATDADPGDRIMKRVWDPRNPPLVEDEMGFTAVQRPMFELD